ncbi:hypothetical protein EDC01DRAFT_201043 [Geopyxis carbonaria]|nr:hypothetical protein EDC01DRAFT_201043 [Geopyxis carbonaria]
MPAQVSVIRKAYARAGLSEENYSETSYFECHGTGTPVGDPIEVDAIGEVFAPTRTPSQPLLIGSVKTNLGHSEAACSLTSMMKVVLAFENEKIPPTIGIKKINPAIDLRGGRLQVLTHLADWPSTSSQYIRRASINSFGYGGANGHIIMESVESMVPNLVVRYSLRCQKQFLNSEVHINGNASLINGNEINGALPNGASAKTCKKRILPFSAHSIKVLKNTIEENIKILGDYEMKDIFHTLLKKSQFDNRGFALVEVDTDKDKFKSLEMSSHNTGFIDADEKRNLVFILTGQGAQWSEMGSSLMEEFTVIRDTVRELDGVLQRLPEAPSWSLEDKFVEGGKFDEPIYAQSLCTALQIAIIDLLCSWSIDAVGFVGHSSGEIAAAYAAGLITKNNAIRVAYIRGKTVSVKTPVEGSMLAVALGPEDVIRYIKEADADETVLVACINSPNSVTLSGDKAQILSVKSVLDREGIFARELRTGGKAYHSHHMKALGPKYQESLELVHEDATNGPETSHKKTMVSSVTGDVITSVGPSYWRQNLESPVLFAPAVNRLTNVLDLEISTFIEIGPHSALEGPLKQILSKINYHSALRRGKDTVSTVLQLAGHLFSEGYKIDLNAVNDVLPEASTPKLIIDLPRYQWDYSSSSNLVTESRPSAEWRFIKYPRHEILGRRVAGNSSLAPTWKNVLRVSEIPWLKDHTLGTDVVFPAAGYLSMAIEAVSQTIETERGRLPDGFKFLDVAFKSPMQVPDTAEGLEITLSLNRASVSAVLSSKTRFEFTISSTRGRDGNFVEHCRGYISAEFKRRVVKMGNLSNLNQEINPEDWYTCFEKVGLKYGSRFRCIKEVKGNHELYEAAATLNVSRKHQNLANRYVLHPGEIDSLLQLTLVASHRGQSEMITRGYMPALATEISIWSPTTVFPADSPDEILPCHSTSIVGQRNLNTGCTVVNDAGELVVQIKDLISIAADLSPETKEELRGKAKERDPYSRIIWKPDIDSINQEDMDKIFSKLSNADHALSNDLQKQGNQFINTYSQVLAVVDLVAHKNTSTKILQIGSAIGADILSKHILDALHGTSNVPSYGSYSFFMDSFSEEIVAGLQELLEDYRNIYFMEKEPSKDILDENLYDLVILNEPINDPTSSQMLVARNSLKSGGRIVYLAPTNLESSLKTLEDSGFSKASTLVIPGNDPRENKVVSALKSNNEVLDLVPAQHLLLIYRNNPHELSNSLQEYASGCLGWTTEVETLAAVRAEQLEPKNAPVHVVVLAELEGPLFSDITEDEWLKLKSLCASESIIWVTAGGLLRGDNPLNAMVDGFGRVLMIEHPATQFCHLDFEPASINTDSEQIVSKIIWAASAVATGELGKVGNDLIRHSGVDYISRIYPDHSLNQGFRENIAIDNTKPEYIPLTPERAMKVDMGRFNPGSMDTLVFIEDKDHVTPLLQGEIEIQTKAIGLNMKDVMIITGRVDSRCFPHEVAGIVSRIGPGVRDFKNGDRVVAARSINGAFGNYQRADSCLCYKLLDHETFNDMTTIPIAYGTAIYGLNHLARLQKGETCLIHAASGGLGIAAIQVARLAGAKIFATVGSAPKRKFLVDKLGIPDECIFNSRDNSFYEGIMEATNGEGIDVILSPLSGDLMTDTWKLIARFGRFVDVGRKEVNDHGKLDLTPFMRNASFFSFDMATDRAGLIHKLFDETFALLRQGKLTPIRPLTEVSIEDLVPTVQQFMEGKHIGKFVITYDRPDIKVRGTRLPTSASLRPDGTYLLVGGLGGLGRSLASWMCTKGAKNLLFIGRSGDESPVAKKFIQSLRQRGINAQVIKGDASKREDVKRAVAAASHPIRGVIQGAMALADRLLSSMTLQEFLVPITAKVQGTINLHESMLKSKQELDFFVMMSSVSGSIGAPWQANYGAANTFLDNFARYRRSLGLPAASIGIGAVLEVGYVSEHADVWKNLSRSGNYGIPENELLQAMELAIVSQKSSGASFTSRSSASFDPLAESFTLLGTDVSQLRKSLEDSPSSGHWRDKDVRLGYVVRALKEAAGINTSKTHSAATVASASSREDIEGMIFVKLSEIMMTSEAQLKAARSRLLGLDSFMATELRMWIYKTFQTDVSFLELLSPSLTVPSLADKLLQKVKK